MSLFADYEPRRTARSPHSPLASGELAIRVARRGDEAELGRINHERDGGELERQVLGFETELIKAESTGEPRLWVAERGGKIVGYSRVHQRVVGPDEPADAAPGGWYLGGVIVDRASRRLGIATALTRVRLAWLAGRAECCWYIVSALNRASLDLHEKLGFEEVTREFSFPNVSFTGGVGLLGRRDLRHD